LRRLFQFKYFFFEQLVFALKLCDVFICTHRSLPARCVYRLCPLLSAKRRLHAVCHLRPIHRAVYHFCIRQCVHLRFCFRELAQFAARIGFGLCKRHAHTVSVHAGKPVRVDCCLSLHLPALLVCCSFLHPAYTVPRSRHVVNTFLQVFLRVCMWRLMLGLCGFCLQWRLAFARLYDVAQQFFHPRPGILLFAAGFLRVCIYEFRHGHARALEQRGLR
jgi:hypothetical protein